jgi:hypothetical protein
MTSWFVWGLTHLVNINMGPNENYIVEEFSPFNLEEEPNQQFADQVLGIG